MGQDVVGQNFVGQDVAGAISLGQRGGAHPKKTKKNQSLHQNWQIGIGFFWFFKISKLALVFFGFFWFFLVFLALVLARIRNWKLVFFGFFWVFLVFFGFFLVFFGLSFGQHSKLETGFWVFLVFFGFFLGFFGIFWFFFGI